MSDYGQRLKAARKAAGLTQRELAAQVGADFTSISHLEHGRFLPSSALAAKFSETIGADLRLPDEVQRDHFERMYVEALASGMWYEAALTNLRNKAREILGKGDYDAILTGPRDWFHTTAAEKAPWEEKARAMLELQR